MGKENLIKDKAILFAIRVVKLYKYLYEVKKETVIGKQLLRSGTAIGALVHESEFAESPQDFIHKLAIGLKEANETVYWLQILFRTDYISEKEFESIEADTKEIIKLLVAIINTSKENRNKANNKN